MKEKWILRKGLWSAFAEIEFRHGKRRKFGKILGSGFFFLDATKWFVKFFLNVIVIDNGRKGIFQMGLWIAVTEIELGKIEAR